MSQDTSDITKLSRQQLEENYVFILHALSIMLRREGGSTTISDDDVIPEGGLERLWIEELTDSRGGLRLSLQPHTQGDR
jgi:hypothetical protein